MYNAVKKFFALHHHLVLPGIGNFLVEKEPAEIDFINRRVTPLQHNIAFNNDKRQPEEKFFHFLSGELNTDHLQAKHYFAGFIEKLRDQLDQKNSIYFKGIGTLTKQAQNLVAFQPEVLPEYFPVLTAERVIRKNVVHSVRVGEEQKTSHEMHSALQNTAILKKEKWWIAATVLGAIGIAAIIFYYAVLN